MRAAPPVELTVAPDRLWRVLVIGALLAALLTLVAWAWLAASVAPRWRVAALLMGLPLFGWIGWHEKAAGALHLRWDGQCWHWRELAAPRSPSCSGRLGVVADFGDWMLLRLVPAAGSHGSRRWLAVGRPALPAHWHALRCAVYSAAPSHSPSRSLPPAGPHER